MQEGVSVADKRQVKNCKTLDSAGAEPDFLIFKRRKGKQMCHLVELKDGDSFDTKKASAERDMPCTLLSKRTIQYLQYIVSAHFCSFNQDEQKSNLRIGFKKKYSF